MSNGDWYYDNKGNQVAVDWTSGASMQVQSSPLYTKYSCRDFIGNTIHVGSKAVYISFGSLATGVITCIDYNTDKVTIHNEKYPINADEVVVYE